MTREEAIEILHDIYQFLRTQYTHRYTQKVAIDMAIEALQAEPVRHGRWVKVYGEHLSMGHRPWAVCCSECDKFGDYTNYCPNCGAKMGGGVK